MIRSLILILILNSFLLSVEAQTVFHTADITNFYEAFDSIQTTSNKERQLQFVQELYVNRGSEGLNYAIRINEQNGLTATSEDWLHMMYSSKEHFEKIRPFFSTLSNQMSVLEGNFLKFKKLYPSFIDGNVYFIVGLGLFGGRPEGTNLYIGCEILASEKPNWAVNIVLHEYVHTLQKHSNNALLAHSLNEGACDFIAELISGIPLREVYPNGYIDFGYKYEAEIWQEFKKYISSSEKGRFFDWLYGTKGKIISGQEMKDLGYFVGYRICKSYYDNSTDKTQAIKDIIEMDVSQDEFARAFLDASNYVPVKDRKFIANFKFAKLTEVKGSFKFKNYGYKIKNDMVIFTFTLPNHIDKESIRYITMAGNFNEWNPEDLNFKMRNVKGSKYEFRLPKVNFNDGINEFKFVVNGNDWQAIPDDALNTQNGNLTFEIE